jgi:hypothetical protein
MRWLKRNMRKVGIALAGLLLLLALMVWVPVSAASTSAEAPELAIPESVQATPTVDVTATMTALNEEKLRQEIQQLKNQNYWAWTTIGPILVGFAGLLAALYSFITWIRNRRDEQKKRDEEQKRWLEDQQAERAKRDEDRLQKAVEGLGSGRLDAKLGAAVMLYTFLLPNYERFYRQVFRLAVTQLRPQKEVLDTPEPLDALRQEIARVFTEAFPLARDVLKQKSQFDPFLLDASGVQLDKAYLSRTDLEGIRMRQAYLRGTHFWQTNLKGAYLKRSDLREAYLVEAHLAGTDLGRANLAGADLRKAQLAGAHLKYADLTGADLTGADLTDTRPQGAKSLKNAIMRDVTGLSQVQRDACAAAGAIIDNSNQPSSPDTGSSSSPSLSLQGNNPQAPLVPPVQVSPPSSSTDGSC